MSCRRLLPRRGCLKARGGRRVPDQTVESGRGLRSLRLNRRHKCTEHEHKAQHHKTFHRYSTIRRFVAVRLCARYRQLAEQRLSKPRLFTACVSTIFFAKRIARKDAVNSPDAMPACDYEKFSRIDFAVMVCLFSHGSTRGGRQSVLPSFRCAMHLPRCASCRLPRRRRPPICPAVVRTIR